PHFPSSRSNPPSEHASSGGGDAPVDVTAPSGCPWIVQSRANWIIVTMGSVGSGSGRVRYAVTTNTGRSARAGTMLIDGLTFTVTQDGAPGACSYRISPNKRNIGAAGGTGSVTIKTASGCAWSAQGPDNWIAITSASSGAGGGTLTFTVAAN